MSAQSDIPKRKAGSFYPPQRTLMGPGPSDVHPRVLSAATRSPIGYLDPIFAEMMEELKGLLRYAFQTRNAATFPVSGPGSAGMEMCFVNMVSPGDKIIVCRNGVFGGRMIENVERCGGVPIVVEDAWGAPVDPNKVEEALRKNPDAKIVAFVHAETSTGVASDAKSVAALAQEHGAMTIMDAVTSLAGVPVLLDEWGIDACYAASQKCLSCAPGLAPITFSDRVVELVRGRREKVHSFFMDLSLLLGYWGATTRTYHHTTPCNSLYALHESLLMLQEEGLENSWARHERNHKALRAGLETFGLSFLVEEKDRLPQMNAVHVLPGIDEKEVRRRLLLDYNLEIGAGLGDLAGKIWRFGIMGYSSKMENVMLCLCALETVFADVGVDVHFGAAESAAHHAYASNPMRGRLAKKAAA